MILLPGGTRDFISYLQKTSSKPVISFYVYPQAARYIRPLYITKFDKKKGKWKTEPIFLKLILNFL